MRRTSRLLVASLTSLAAVAATSVAFADGIDVSHWQRAISWSEVQSAGTQFAFMKATESTTYTDARFATNWAGAQSVGLYRGAYHFARPQAGNAVPQAAYFVAAVGSFLDAGTLPPVLDLEASGGMSVSALRSWTLSWLTTVEGLTGRTPVIYVSPAFWEHYLGNSTAFTRYPLWIAHYGVSAPRVPGGWSTWTLWQRTNTGSVSGIAGNVDLNEFNGTSAQLATLANTTGGSTAPVPLGPTLPVAGTTALTMTPSTVATAVVNDPVTFAGNLTRTADATAVAGLPVVLDGRRIGTTGWRRVAKTTTDAAGHYAVTARVPAATAYRTVFAGHQTYAGTTSAVMAVRTPRRAAIKVHLGKNKMYRVRKGTKVMLYGHAVTAAGPVTGTYVRYYRRPAHGGRWTYVGRAATRSPTGWYATNVHPRRSTTYKVVSFATIFLTSRTSNRVTVRVR